VSKRIHEGAIRDEIAKTSGDSKKLLRDFSTELFNCIRQGLLTDGHVKLHQFGSLKLKWTKQRKGKNPKTGESLIIPAHPRITFAATKALKDKASTGTIEKIKPGVIEKNALSEKTPKPDAIAEKKTSVTHIKKPVTQINSEPYLLKNISSFQSKEKRKPFPVALVAALLLLISAIYFISVDTETEKTLATVEIIQHTGTAIKSAEPALDDKTSFSTIAAKEASDSNTLNKNIILQHKPIVFFKQRPHKLTDGDSLWRLSRKNYINPFYWPHIYQANKYKIRNPDKLLMGRTITLPTLYGDPENLSNEDRRNIAEGYFLVYRHHKKNGNPFPYYALLGVAKFDPAVIEDHAYEIDEEDWNNLQLASN